MFEDYDLWRHLHLWVGVWVVLWMGGSVGQWVGSGQITKNLINLDLIEIIQFCLKIYDLLRHLNPHPHPLVEQRNSESRVKIIRLHLST